MYLQLSENGNYVAPPIYYMSERRRTRVKAYSRKFNYVPAHYRSLSEGQEDNPYLFIPDLTGQSKGYFSREDNFDDLDQREWNQLMRQLLPYQPQVQAGMSENMFLSAKAGRKAKRADRKKNRDDKKKAKVDKKKAKTEIKLARAQAKREGGGSDILGTISDTLGNVFGKGGAEPVEPGEPGEPRIQRAGMLPFGITPVQAGIGAVGIAGLIFLATRKRK